MAIERSSTASSRGHCSSISRRRRWRRRSAPRLSSGRWRGCRRIRARGWSRPGGSRRSTRSGRRRGSRTSIRRGSGRWPPGPRSGVGGRPGGAARQVSRRAAVRGRAAADLQERGRVVHPGQFDPWHAEPQRGGGAVGEKHRGVLLGRMRKFLARVDRRAEPQFEAGGQERFDWTLRDGAWQGELGDAPVRYAARHLGTLVHRHRDSRLDQPPCRTDTGGGRHHHPPRTPRAAARRSLRQSQSFGCSKAAAGCGTTRERPCASSSMR